MGAERGFFLAGEGGLVVFAKTAPATVVAVSALIVVAGPTIDGVLMVVARRPTVLGEATPEIWCFAE